MKQNGKYLAKIIKPGFYKFSIDNTKLRAPFPSPPKKKEKNKNLGKMHVCCFRFSAFVDLAYLNR